MRLILCVLAFATTCCLPAQDFDISDLKLCNVLDSAKKCNKQSNIAQAEVWLKRALPMLKTNASKADWFTYRYTMATNLFNKHEIVKARAELDSALQIAFDLNDSTKLSKCYQSIANTYSVEANFREALKQYQKSLSYSSYDTESNYHATLMNMTHAYIGLNQHDKAIENLTKTKDYFLKTKNYRSLAVTENNIGEIYRENFKNYEKAKAHYLRAIAANNQVADKAGLAMNYHNLAIIFSYYNQMDSARYYAVLSKQLKEGIGDEGGLASSYHLLAGIYNDEGNPSKAEEYYLKALGICENRGIAKGVFYCHLDLGQLYFDSGELVKSTNHYKVAEKIAVKSGEFTTLSRVYSGLYSLNKKKGKVAIALTYLEKTKNIDDSIHSTLNNQHLDELRASYEVDMAEAENELLKEKEQSQSQALKDQEEKLYLSIGFILLLLAGGVWLISLLRQRNQAHKNEKASKELLAQKLEELLQSEEQLAQSNSLKDKILSVIGHDLRSPMVAIAGLIDTMSAVEVTREELSELLVHLKKGIDTSLVTLQEVLAWSRLQMNEEGLKMEDLNLPEMLDEVLDIYEPNLRAKRIDLKTEIDANLKLTADKNQVKSIVGNLLSNAIKFSPKDGNILISLKNENNHISFHIKDEGKGISETVLANLNSRDQIITVEGTDGEEGSGIGLRIVSDFVNAHKGNLYFKNNEQIGSTVTVSLPKPSAN